MNTPTPRAARPALSVSALRAGSVILLAVLLAACGGGDSSDGYSSSPGGPGGAGGLGAAPPVSQKVTCKDFDFNDVTVEPKSITVQNNSNGTIYPVLATSKNAVNQWLQGCFRSTDPYPTDYVYKLYVNQGEGIPPGGSVTITLPLYSKLSEDRYITWWNGGRVVLADRSERLLGSEDTALTTPDTVICEGQGTECSLSTYSSPVQFPENVYAQLSEYTFGDSVIPAGESVRLLKPDNVGYNISYVDHVYMPVGLGPKDNPYIGYSGSVQSQAYFRNKLGAFLADNATAAGNGWPVYNLSALKLPGGYNIFAQRSGTLPPSDNVPVKPTEGFPPVLTVMKCINDGCTDEERRNLHFGQAVQRMQNLWGSCVDWTPEENAAPYVTDTSVACPAEMRENMKVVKDFFIQNHQDYLAMHSRGECESSTPQVPKFNYWNAMMHIYGWVPYNEGCGADANPLANTTIDQWNHAKIQPMYIHDLQYNYQQQAVKNDPRLVFNPYVQLIHDDLEMNAYGFSVDDAVGFMSELGSGLIFTVGGSEGLENQKQFSYADGFFLDIGVPESKIGHEGEPLIKKYGVCVFNQDPDDLNCEKDKQDVIMPTHSQIAGFRVGTVASYPIKVRFTDAADNLYTIRVNEKFAECNDGDTVCPKNKTSIVDKASCVVVNSRGEKHDKSDGWCGPANPNQQKEKQLTKNHLSFPKPVEFLP
ncbi:hypothetical protein ACSBPU_20460 [Parapusillimonas sp. JC17]|uniref:hypothetical protein n=1 Tax=Parapusillimonas sp. JC17 TaxID=3445768 RepID=UPI003FA09D6C